MIPFFRIHFSKEYDKGRFVGDFSPKTAINKIMDKWVKRRSLYVVEYNALVERYAKMVSGSWYRTGKSIRLDGHGFVRDVGFHQPEVSPWAYDKKSGRYCNLYDKIERTKEDKLVEPFKTTYVYSNLKWSYSIFPKRSKFISWINACGKCGKIHKTTKHGAGYCRSCSAKMAYYKGQKKEVAEVNRLLRNIKKVIKDESKRLKKEACDNHG